MRCEKNEGGKANFQDASRVTSAIDNLNSKEEARDHEIVVTGKRRRDEVEKECDASQKPSLPLTLATTTDLTQDRVYEKPMETKTEESPKKKARLSVSSHERGHGGEVDEMSYNNKQSKTVMNDQSTTGMSHESHHKEKKSENPPPESSRYPKVSPTSTETSDIVPTTTMPIDVPQVKEQTEKASKQTSKTKVTTNGKNTTTKQQLGVGTPTTVITATTTTITPMTPSVPNESTSKSKSTPLKQSPSQQHLVHKQTFRVDPPDDDSAADLLRIAKEYELFDPIDPAMYALLSKAGSLEEFLKPDFW